MNVASSTERFSNPGEMRFGERIRLEVPVTLDAGNGRTGDGMLRDISISGALIATRLELPTFTNLVVTLTALSESQPPRRLAACVVRRSPDGIGVEWRDMACETLLTLLRDAGCDATRVAPCDSAFR